MTETKVPRKVFRVVDILSPSRIVLDCGSNDGITHESRFKIYAYGNEIKNFETGETLERVYLPRGPGRVVVLQKRICTIESTKRVTPTMFTLSFSTSIPELEPFDQAQIGDYADLIEPEKK